jgi:hypothetical protein
MKVLWVFLGLAVLCLVPPARAEDKKPAGKTYQVPYRLTATNHVLVRAKINGKGPFNFILDTGAPALYVATAVCHKLGVEADKNGWGTFDRFEIEGGVVVEPARGRVEDPFQLEGMNGMGLAGAQLHGILGYNVLARFRMELDFTRDKMAWTELDFTPPPPIGLGGPGGAPGGLDAFGFILKVVGALLGRKAEPDVEQRGLLGIVLADAEGAVTVQTVLPRSPAAQAGLKPGDRINRFHGQPVKSSADIHRLAARLTFEDTVEVTVVRGGQHHQLTIKVGEGL